MLLDLAGLQLILTSDAINAILKLDWSAKCAINAQLEDVRP